jgi:hypothetical protein
MQFRRVGARQSSEGRSVQERRLSALDQALSQDSIRISSRLTLREEISFEYLNVIDRRPAHEREEAGRRSSRSAFPSSVNGPGGKAAARQV